MLRRIVRFTVILPALAILAAIGLANTQDVRLALDPFRPDDPALSLVQPFYVWLLGAAIVGVLIGGAATWVSQAHWRQSARRRGAEAERWKAEAARLTSERQLEAARR